MQSNQQNISTLSGLPLLKWPGGKRKLLPQLRSHMPKDYGSYYEPFMGGGALFCDLSPTDSRLSDSNAELINCYLQVRDNASLVLAHLKTHAIAHTPEDSAYYLSVRSAKLQNLAERAARFIYLNQTCFNGLYRVNKSGHFNVPMGRYKNPSIYCEEKVLAMSARLKQASISHQDFNQINPQSKDFVYFDPPYDPISKTASFTGYTAEGFGDADQIRLAKFAAKLSAKGVYFLISNSNTSFVRDLYDDFSTHEITAPRSISCKGRNPASELLITNC